MEIRAIIRDKERLAYAHQDGAVVVAGPVRSDTCAEPLNGKEAALKEATSNGV